MERELASFILHWVLLSSPSIHQLQNDPPEMELLIIYSVIYFDLRQTPVFNAEKYFILFYY